MRATIRDRRELSPSVRTTSALYLGTGIVGSVVALAGDYPGIPLGIDVGLTSPQGVWVGWGSGVSAPWPMLVALALTGIAGLGPRWMIPSLGLMFASGGLMEPIFWEANTGALGVGIAALVWLNVVIPLVLVTAWVGALRRERVEP